MSFLKHRLIGRGVALLCLTASFATSSAIGAGPGHDPIARAAELLTQGRLVEAKHELSGLDRDALSAEQRERAFELMTAVDRRMKHADPVDISLQKAEWALGAGDLREADRQAHAAKRADQATPEQRTKGTEILERSATLKAELAPMVGPALEQALADLDASRFAEAKAGLDSVHRSGISLSPAQMRSVERARERILALEQSRGEPFAFKSVSLSLLQPGRVTERTDPAQPGEQPPETPAHTPAPASQPAAEQPATTEQQQDAFNEAMRFDAQRRLAEADAAFEAGRYNESLQRYQEVAGAYRRYVAEADAARSDARIAEINALLQRPGGEQLERLVGDRAILAEQARAEFDNFLTEARTALAGGDVERARSLASQARLRLSDVRDLFSEQEYNDRLARQQALVQEIIAREEQIRQQEASQREASLAAEARAAEAARQAEKQAKINEALDRVRALQMERKYDEALQVVDQILFLDPLNPAGMLLKDTLQDVILYQMWDETQRAKTLSYARESNEIQLGMIAPQNLLDYPADWPELSFRRGEPMSFAESASDRRVLAELDSKRIPASFADNTLEDVLEFVATVTNLNVDVDWDSLSDIGVTRDTLVTLNLQPLPARVVLDRVLQKVSPDGFSRAGWAVNDGVLVVASDQDLRKNTFIVIYDVRDLLFQIPSFTQFPRLDLDSVLNQGQGGGGQGSIFQDDADQTGDRLTKEELKDALLEILQTNVDFDGWKENGGDTGVVQELNDNLIITNTAANHRQISGLLRQLREIRSIQINVETRFLVVSQDFFEQIAFDVDVIFNAMNSQFDDAFAQQGLFDLTRSVSPSGRNSLQPRDLVSPFFVSGSNRNGATNEFFFTDPTDINSEIQVGAVPFVVTRPDGLSMVPAQQNSLPIANQLTNLPFAQEILMLNPALGIAGTFLDDVQVDFLIQATQADRRNVVLTAPRLTFTNGHAANIFVTTQQSFVSDLNPIVGTNSVAFDPQVDVVSTGFALGIDGVVSADRRYVTMTVQTQLAELVEFAMATVTAQTGGGTDGGVGSDPVSSSFQLPIVQVTSISTGATVPDRGTLLLGGQRLTSEVDVEVGVPVLSQIPIINRFFTNTVQSKSEQTLLILIKPTILIQNEEEEKNFPGLLDSLKNRFDSGM